MRFLIMTQYFAPEIGAAATRLAACAREMIRQGHDVEVLTAMPNYPAGRIFPEYRGHFYLFERWEGISIHRVWAYAALGSGIKRAMNYASLALTSLFGLLKIKKPDYLFVETPPPFLIFPAFLASRLWGVPAILNVSDLWPDSIQELGILQHGLILQAAGLAEKWVYRRSDFINAVTKGIWTSLETHKGVPARKLLLLPNGADTKTFKPVICDTALKRKLGLDGKKILLFPGTLGYGQALENALEAAKLLRDNTSIHLLFVGNGSEKAKLVALASRLELRNVTFLDFVPLEQVPRYLSISCCGLVTLKNIALFRDVRPAKLLPIMACAKPVLFSGPAGEVTRMLTDAKGGLIVPPEDPAALAHAMERIANDSVLAEDLGRNGRQYVEQHLTWSKLVASWLGQLNDRAVDNPLVAARKTGIRIPA